MTGDQLGDPGPVLFARFAYPPNQLGYCGPDLAAELFDYAAAGVADGGLRTLARGFAGAWPYLQLIAAANRIADPLDARVVEAYWVGNALLDRVPGALLAGSVDERFRREAGRGYDRILDSVAAGAVPHHNFHVFSVYPWVGLLRAGRVDAPLSVVDRCRIRWGRVESVEGDRLLVRSRPLEWSAGRLHLGAPRSEMVLWRGPRGAMLGDPVPGDVVAMHWDWACMRLDARAAASLRRETVRQMQVATAASCTGAPAADLRFLRKGA